MASFTDQISNFNPYVQQLPVEAMAQVGMQKQAQYDAGVQKIQGYVDNIAGIEVLRPQDKAILQSKLNELGSKLKTVAAGDFSNQQLVNSVGGMASSIIKDEDVMNAVSSTSAYKKGLEERKAYLKEGKTSPSNDHVFNLRAEKWLNGDLKETFSGGYDPYTNWKKEGLEILKSVTGDSTLTEDAFTADGKLADAITRKKYAGISPEKIQSALQAALSPAALRQMEIDGLYSYSDKKTPVEVDNLIRGNFNDKRRYFEEQKTALENSLTETNDATVKEGIRSKINDLNKFIGNYNKQEGKLLDLVKENKLDSAKASLYSLDSIINFSKAFSYTEVAQTYENSPLADMAMRREVKKQERDLFYIRLNNDNYWKGLEYELDLRKVQNEEKATQALIGGVISDIPQDELPKNVTSRFIEDAKTLNTDLNQKDKSFVSTFGKDEVWLDKQREAWEKRPNSVDPRLAAYFNQTEEQRRTVESNTTTLQNIENEANAKFGDVKKLIPKGSPNLIYRSGNDVFEYTPSDFVELNNMRGAYQKSYSGAGGASAMTYDKETAKKELSPKQYHLWEVANGLAPKNNANKVLQDNLSNYNKLVNTPYSKMAKQRSDFVNTALQDRIFVGQGVEYTIPTYKPEQKDAMAGNLNSLANIAEKQKGKLPGMVGTVEDMRIIAADPNATFTMKVSGGTQYQPKSYRVTAVGKDGRTVQFNLPEDMKVGAFGQMFEASPAKADANRYISQLNKMGGQTTAIDGNTKVNTPQNSFMTNIDFPQVKTFGIKSNLVPLSGGGYGFRLSIYDPLKNKWVEDVPYPRNGAMQDEDIANQRLGMTDAALYELIYGAAPTQGDLQKIQKASKNPL